MQQFDDRVAVITGAASGIGLAIARHAAELGMHLVLADIDELALVEAAKSLNLKSERRLICRQVDVSKAASVQALADAAAAVQPPSASRRRLSRRGSRLGEASLGPPAACLCHGPRCRTPSLKSAEDEIKQACDAGADDEY